MLRLTDTELMDFAAGRIGEAREHAAASGNGGKSNMPLIKSKYVAEFVPEEDAFETLPDGRVRQIAFAGVPMSKGEAARLGLLLAEQPKAEQPKAEQPKAEQPKAEQPKAEQPKAEQPKAEPKKKPGPKQDKSLPGPSENK